MDGPELRSLRKAKGWSQDYLSTMSGISTTSISYYENQKIKTIPEANQRRFAEVFETGKAYVPAKAVESLPAPAGKSTKTHDLDDLVSAFNGVRKALLDKLDGETLARLGDADRADVTARLCVRLGEYLRACERQPDMREAVAKRLPKATAGYVVFMLNGIYQNDLASGWIFGGTRP